MGDAMRGTNVRLDTQTLASDHWIKSEDVERFEDEVKTVCPIQNRLFKAYYDVTVNEASRIWHGSQWWLGGCSSQFRCLYMHWLMAKCWTRTAEEDICPVWWNWNLSCVLPSSLRIIDLWYDQNRRTVSDFFGIFYSQYVLMQYSAKYPLAIVDHFLTTYGSDIGAAYNVGYALQPTLMNSLLGPHMRDLNLCLMVGSANSPGTHSTFWAQAIQKVMVVSISSHHQMIRLTKLPMLHDSTGIKPLRNTLISGIRINMLHSVSSKNSTRSLLTLARDIFV